MPPPRMSYRTLCRDFCEPREAPCAGPVSASRSSPLPLELRVDREISYTTSAPATARGLCRPHQSESGHEPLRRLPDTSSGYIVVDTLSDKIVALYRDRDRPAAERAAVRA
jgi:hypothetical protein